jgi:hypothetical protein
MEGAIRYNMVSYVGVGCCAGATPLLIRCGPVAPQARCGTRTVVCMCHRPPRHCIFMCVQPNISVYICTSVHLYTLRDMYIHSVLVRSKVLAALVNH